MLNETCAHSLRRISVLLSRSYLVFAARVHCTLCVDMRSRSAEISGCSFGVWKLSLQAVELGLLVYIHQDLRISSYRFYIFMEIWVVLYLRVLV